MGDLHEVSFSWPDTKPRDVILTGSFDQWNKSIHLDKSPNGFEGKVKVPWETRIPYKFIVDGKWMILQSQPSENDGHGNINNIFVSPPKPMAPTDEATVEPNSSQDIPDATATFASPIGNEVPMTAGQNDKAIHNIHKETVAPSPSKLVSTVESTDSDDLRAVSPSLLPLNGPLSAAAAEITVPSEVVDSYKSNDLPAVSPNVLPLNDPTTAVELAVPSAAENPSSAVTPDPVISTSIEFPNSEILDGPISTTTPVTNHTLNSNTQSPQRTTERDTSPEPRENEPKVAPPSPASSSHASSFLGLHLRGGSEPRQRSVSSRSGSVRSDSQRQKRHSLLGKVKHLFHLDKDS